MKHILFVALVSLASLTSLAACDDNATCQGDHCACTGGGACTVDCTPGAAECHVQGSPGEAVDVVCDNNGECHVECSQASSCNVDCGGSADCDVTCPPTGCTVTSCVDCDVTCGLTGIATHAGTTATCP
jgi:hypothetical protein